MVATAVPVCRSPVQLSGIFFWWWLLLAAGTSLQFFAVQFIPPQNTILLALVAAVCIVVGALLQIGYTRRYKQHLSWGVYLSFVVGSMVLVVDHHAHEKDRVLWSMLSTLLLLIGVALFRLLRYEEERWARLNLFMDEMLISGIAALVLFGLMIGSDYLWLANGMQTGWWLSLPILGFGFAALLIVVYGEFFDNKDIHVGY